MAQTAISVLDDGALSGISSMTLIDLFHRISVTHVEVLGVLPVVAIFLIAWVMQRWMTTIAKTSSLLNTAGAILSSPEGMAVDAHDSHIRLKLLANALAALSPRERTIIRRRHRAGHLRHRFPVDVSGELTCDFRPASLW